MARNKNRVYLALYRPMTAAGADTQVGHDHQALLLAPKAGAAAWRFRAARGGGDDRWRYCAEHAPLRSSMLAALVRLGKTTLGGPQLDEALRVVPLKRVDNCTVWATEAVHTLIDRDVIDVPPSDLVRLARRAGRLADAFAALPAADRLRKAVPTIGADGARIVSEVLAVPAGGCAENTPADEAEEWC